MVYLLIQRMMYGGILVLEVRGEVETIAASGISF